MAAVLRDTLEKQAHRIVVAASARTALTLLCITSSKQSILYAMLPGMNGFTVARSLRNSKLATPVHMLTARDRSYQASVPDRS